MTENVEYVNPSGESIPAPTLCLSEHPRHPAYLCEYSLGHTGPCEKVVVLELPGNRRPYVKRFKWNPTGGAPSPLPTNSQ